MQSSAVQRLSVLCARHPWRTLAAWFVVLCLAVAASAALLGSALTVEGGIQSEPESLKGQNLLDDRFPARDEVSELVVVRSETGSVGNCMGDPTPVYVILEGVMDGEADAPFSIQFVRVPYDWEAELAVASEMGMPELAGYTVEIRDGVYRGNLKSGEAPDYHRG